MVAATLLTLVVLTALVLLALTDRRETDRMADRRHALLARLHADTLNRGLLSASEAAASPARLLASGAEPADPVVQALMAQSLVDQPWLRSLGILDDQGVVLASTEAQDVSSRVSLEALGSLPAGDVEVLGEMVTARHLRDLDAGRPESAAPAGVGFLPLIRAVQHPVRGVMYVVATLHVDWFINQWHVMSLADDLAFAIVRQDGSLVAASPGSGRPARSDLSGLAPFRDFLPRRESGQWRGAGLRQAPQAAAFHAAASRPVIVLVESDQDLLYRAWLSQVQGLAALATVSVLVIVGMTILALRTLSASEADQARLRQAQNELSRRERELDTTISSVQEAVFRTDPAGQLQLVNPSWARLAGTAVARSLGEPLARFVVEADRHLVSTLFASAATSASRETVVRLRAQDDGSIRTAQIKVIPVREGGQLLGFAGSAVDITRQEANQQALQAQLAFVGRMIDTHPMPISAMNLEGRYIIVNAAWERFTGISRSRALGSMVGDHLSSQERRPHEQADDRLRATGEPQIYEAQVADKDGSRREVVVHKMLLPDDAGATAGILAVLHDVTEFRRAERAIREARDAAQESARTQTEFIANTSHELRTPLQAILGFSELGERKALVAQPALAAVFGDIRRAGDRLLGLVNALLDIAKVESAVGSMHLSTVDLRTLVRTLLRELDPVLASRRQSVDLSLPESPLLAKADALRMMQVLRHVLTNAMKYSPPGSVIQLLAAANAFGEPGITVQDQGPGIPAAEMEAIFGAFVQSSQTRDGSGGTGLGLAITRKIVQAHGGRIHAENAPEGGAVFHIVLPVRGAAETQPMPL